MRFAIHLLLHVAVPYGVARALYRPRLRSAFLIMIATMAVDLDHLLATPIIDPGRCSIDLHPLHSYPAIGLWFIVAIFPRTRLVGLGLMIHMALDAMDCLWLRAC